MPKWVHALSLRTKLILTLLSLSIFASVTIMLFANRITAQALEQAIGGELRNLADSKALAIGDLLARQLDALHSLSLDRTLRARLLDANNNYTAEPATINAKIQEMERQWAKAEDTDLLIQMALKNTAATELRLFQTRFPDHIELFLTDRYGAVLAATKRTSDYWQADEAWWQAAYNAGAGATHIAAPAFDHSMETLALRIAVPVYDRDNATVSGILAATYRLNTFERLMITQGGDYPLEVKILLPDHYMLASTGDHLERIAPEHWAQLQANAEATYTVFAFDKGPHLVSQSPVMAITGEASVAALEWRVIVYQNQQIALAPVAAQHRVILLLTGGVMLIAIITGSGAAYWLTRPITDLTRATKRIIDGDLDEHVEIRSNDEIGALAAGFNTMTRRLRQTLTTLEQRMHELQTTHEALRASNGQLQSIIRAAPTGIGLVSDRVILQVNTRICEMTGYTSEELIGQSARLLYPTDADYEYVGSSKYRQIRESGTGTVETRWQRKDGEVIDVLLSSTPLDPDNLSAGVTFTALDITERKRAEMALRESETRNEAILSAMPDLMFRVSYNGIFIDYRHPDTMGFYAPPDVFMGKSFYDIFPEAFAQRAMACAHAAARTGTLQRMEYQLPYNDDVHDYEARMVVSGEDEILILVRDITERKQAEEALARHARELTALYETALEINAQRDLATLLNAIIERVGSLLGAQMGGLYLINAGDETLEMVTSYQIPKRYLGTQLRFGEGLAGRIAQSGDMMMVEDYTTWEGRHAQYDSGTFRRILGVPLRVGQENIGVITIIDDEKTGRFSEAEIRLVQMFADQAAIAINNTRLFEATQRELAERQRAEKALRESEQLYRSLINVIPEGVALSDLSGTISFISPQLLKIYGGETLDDALGTNALEWIAPESRERAHINIQRLARNKLTRNNEYVTLKKDGTRFHSEITGAVLTDDKGHPTGLVTVHRDITERKQAEEQIMAALQEKEALLREVHHRVKNNLAVICALLDLQSADVESQHVQEAFLESRNRIRSMAYIHDQLTYAENLAQINVMAYIQELVESLRMAYTIGDVDVNIDVSDIVLPFDLISPCGLLINELVSNALKHAFPEGRTGEAPNHSHEIHISLHPVPTESTTVELKISDNGIGLQDNIDITTATSLGLTLVHLLVEQLNGTIEIVRGCGTTFRIVFDGRLRR